MSYRKEGTNEDESSLLLNGNQEVHQNYNTTEIPSISSFQPLPYSRPASPDPSEYHSDDNDIHISEEDQKIHGFRTIRLSLQSVGVIYGDIGTSPLYVFTTIFSDYLNGDGTLIGKGPGNEEVMGALSLILWSLLSIFIIKYVTIVLCADDNGEGGTFALYSIICRYCNIDTRGSNHESDLALTHYDSDDFFITSSRSSRLPFHAKVRRYINRSEFTKHGLLLVVLFGTSLVMGDGILTPAVSVLSAVEGVEIAFPELHKYIMPIAFVIITLLFMGQRLGTARVAKFFAPVILTWLVAIGCIGAFNISKNPTVLKAINPYYAYRYFVLRGWAGWASLGGVEALFADLGHFNRKAIRLSATLYVLPPLLLTYFGQAACILSDSSIITNTFWRSVPNNVYIPTMVVATCAAVVASQAMVSAAFSIIHQAMALGCFPKVNVVHTSRKIHGQVFIPEISFLLMTCSLALVATFQESTKLTAAYGLASCMLMFMTTCLIAVVMIVVWKLHFGLVLAFLLTYMFIDLAFLSSTLLKFTNGGWIPLAFALGFSAVMNLWRWGAELKYQYIKDSQVALNSLLYDPNPSTTPSFIPVPFDTNRSDAGNIHFPGWLLKTNSPEAQPVARVPGLALFYSEASTDAPTVFTHTLNCFSSVPEMVVFVTLRHVVVPTVLPHERFLLTRLAIRGFYRCVARYGYMEVMEPGSAFVNLLIQQLDNNCVKSLENAYRHDARFQANPQEGNESAVSSGTVTPTPSARHPPNFNQSTDDGLQIPSTEIQFRLNQPTRPSKAKVERLQAELQLLRTAPLHGVTFVMGKTLVKADPKSNFFRKLAIDVGFNFLANNDRSFAVSTSPSKTIQIGMPIQL